jgi:hypothetical protein
MNFKQLSKDARRFLRRPVSATNLGILRFGFGSLMLVMLTKYMKLIDDFWNQESAIPFQGLEFIKPLSGENLETVLYIGMAAAVLTAVGIFHRYSCLVLTLVLAYALLMNRVVFNNHYYLFVLVSLLLVFTNADERFSLKSLFRKGPPSKVPQWQYFILQLQLGIVFFYGGLAKINPDWLSGAVMDPMVWKAFGMFELLPEVSLALSWAGMLFDLLIAFFLFWKRTRLFAVIAVVIFNLMNGLILFDNIGLFPYAVIVLTVLLFIDPDVVNRLISKVKLSWLGHRKEKGMVKVPWMGVWTSVLVVHFIFQMTFPLRHYFIEGNPDWTGQGVTFAWRMKSSSKLIKLQFKAIDKATGEFVSDVNMGFDFSLEQLYAYTHYQVWFMAQRVYKRFVERGRTDFGVVADYYVAMNGQPIQRAIDPTVDLSEVKYLPFGKNDWILPWDRKSREEIETIQEETLQTLKKAQN